MADMDLEVATRQLKEIREFADRSVSSGNLPLECRDLFIAEIFRSALRMSEAVAMVQLQRDLRQNDIDESVSRSLGAKLIRTN